MNNATEKGFLNARDFGASGSDFVSKALSCTNTNEIRLESIGDFKVGDEILIKGAFIHQTAKYLFEKKDSSPINPRPWHHNRELESEIELRGYNGEHGGRAVYFIDFDPDEIGYLRWSVDFGRSWNEHIPAPDGEYVSLEADVKIKINSLPERLFGATVVIVCSDMLIATVTAVKGNVLYISEKANRTAECTVSHSDTAAIQRAINAAIKDSKSVFLPKGKYKITKSLIIDSPASFTFEGECAEETVIDNSLGNVGVERPEGSCFIIRGGKEFNLKNLTMLGCLGFDNRDIAGCIKTKGGNSVWGFYFNKSNAICISSTERVYVENCHARMMSAECFYSRGDSRRYTLVPEDYTKSIIYNRCSVVDCARNAFNNNDQAEGTTITNCRVERVGGCAWEGASRFVKIQGSYFRWCGPIAIGNVRRREENLEHLGTGQHIISDNYFEEGCAYSDSMIMIGSTATQVIVKGNVFVNFNSNAVKIFGEGNTCDKPPENVIVSSNIIDLSAENGRGIPRIGISASAPFVTVSDNHIYTRYDSDKNTKGIVITGDLVRTVVHDNILASLDIGIESRRVTGSVGIVADNRSFYRKEKAYGEYATPPLVRIRSHRYRGWRILWDNGEYSVIEDFDPVSLRFTLSEPREIKSGDPFTLLPPVGKKNILIHHNLIDGCNEAIRLDPQTQDACIINDNAQS